MQPADSKRVRGEPSATVVFEDLEHFLALAQAVEHRRDGANIERVGAQPKQMAGDAIQLGQNHADRLRARRSFNVQQLFNGQAVAQRVRDRRDVVHAVHVRRELLISAILSDFLHAAMQIADDALGAHHLFAVQLEDHAKHAVRGGVLRTHVDD